MDSQIRTGVSTSQRTRYIHVSLKISFLRCNREISVVGLLGETCPPNCPI